MEKELEVKTILVNYMCDDCGEKVEYLDGHMILTDPLDLSTLALNVERNICLLTNTPIQSTDMLNP